MVKKALLNMATALSQICNTFLLFGDPDETVSGRAYRKGHLDSNSAWTYTGNVINKIFFFQANHIKESYDYDIARARRVLKVHDDRKQRS